MLRSLRLDSVVPKPVTIKKLLKKPRRRALRGAGTNRARRKSRSRRRSTPAAALRVPPMPAKVRAVSRHAHHAVCAGPSRHVHRLAALHSKPPEVPSFSLSDDVSLFPAARI